MHSDLNAGRVPPSAGSPSPALALGRVVGGKYRVEAEIGRGGTSVVYRATHLQLDQQVALKVLSTEALLFPECVERLRREARAVSQIRSEHVVRVHDIGELATGDDALTVPYLVMEHLSGLDLAVVLSRRGPMALELAVECILQACEALAEAHALGIVHRDLKPANLFLTEGVDGSPCVKVLDFGISRMSRSPGLTSLTDPGIVVGTPSYMAPEQMEAPHTGDPRSDIWALGTILHELLIGRPPFAGESLPQIFMKIMRSPPARPSKLRAGVPPEVDAIVAGCLAVEVTDRFQNVAELGWALARLGTPRACDTAARISRVLGRRSGRVELAGSSSAQFSAGEVRGAVARPSRSVAVVLAGIAILGGASALGAASAEGALHALVVHHAPPRVPAIGVQDPLATTTGLTTAPATRPRAFVAPAAQAPAASLALTGTEKRAQAAPSPALAATSLSKGLAASERSLAGAAAGRSAPQPVRHPPQANGEAARPSSPCSRELSSGTAAPTQTETSSLAPASDVD